MTAVLGRLTWHAVHLDASPVVAVQKLELKGRLAGLAIENFQSRAKMVGVRTRSYSLAGSFELVNRSGAAIELGAYRILLCFDQSWKERSQSLTEHAGHVLAAGERVAVEFEIPGLGGSDLATALRLIEQ